MATSHRALIAIAFAACGGGSHRATTGDAQPDVAIAPPGTCTAIPTDESGDGTYYDADGTGNCSFDASPDDLMVAAMNAPDYDNAAWCGACLDVTGPDGDVVVRVVDQCPGCSHGDLDLSPQAFAVLSPLAAGRIPITWHEVACDMTGPIDYEFKTGTSAYYTAIQLRNHRYPIATLESRGSDGTWTAIARASYNYFVVNDGLGAGPYALRVTDARGQILEDDAVPLAAGSAEPGAAQFPTCP